MARWWLAAPFLVFVACAWFTRAPLPRVAAALLAGLAAGAFNFVVDLFGHRAGFWWYPQMGDAGHGPLDWYVAAGLAFGTGLGLIGWRVHRRFGLRGLAIFVAVFALYGVSREWVVSRTVARGVIVFGAGPIPWIADYTAWFTGGALVQAIQIALRGDPRRERLARSA